MGIELRNPAGAASDPVLDKPEVFATVPALCQLRPGAVHVWQIDLELQPEQVRLSREILSMEERERADRFYFERDKLRFIASHAAVRRILGLCLGIMPSEVMFSSGDKGKPELSQGLGESGLKFNLSHSRHRALLAVTLHSSVGVDIEYVDPVRAGEQIARSFFSAQEFDTLQSLPAEERCRAFFDCWTRKEAYIKALGTGLYTPLDSFCVAFGADAPAALLWVNGSPREHLRWSLYDLPMAGDYAAALTVEGSQHTLLRREWDWS